MEKIRKLLLLCSATCFWLQILGQENEKLVVSEGFTSNTLKWPILTTGQATHTLYNGKYVMENSDGMSQWAGIPVNLSLSGDFMISATATHVSGSDKHGFGLYFGAKDANNGFSFCISANGYYLLSKNEKGAVIEVTKWTPSGAIKQGNYTDNILAVRKEGGFWKFYINSALVKSIAPEPFFGDNIGFIKYDNQRIEFDNLQVKELPLAGIPGNTETDLYNDDFSETKYTWNDVKSPDFSAAVSKGRLIHDNYTEKQMHTVKKITNLDNSRDYSFSIKATHLSGVENHAFGLVFGGEDSLMKYYFVISATGSYAVYGHTATVFPWTSHNSIKKGNFTDNFLMVKKEGSKWNFYINNQLVNSYASQFFKEASIGAITYNKQKIEYDNFILRGYGTTGKRTASTGGNIPDYSAGAKQFESGSLCKLFPLIKTQAKNRFKNITGSLIEESKYDKTHKSTYTVNESPSSYVLHSSATSYFFADFGEYTSNAEAVNNADKIISKLKSCNSGYDVVKRINSFSKMQEILLIQKVPGGYKDLGATIDINKNATGSKYSLRLRIPDSKVSDAVYYYITGAADQSTFGQQLQSLIVSSEKEFEDIKGSKINDDKNNDYDILYETSLKLTGAKKSIIVNAEFDLFYEATFETGLTQIAAENAFHALGEKVKKALGSSYVYEKVTSGSTTTLWFVKKEEAGANAFQPVELVMFKTKGVYNVLLSIYNDWFNL